MTVRGVEQSVVSAAHWDRGVYGVPAYMTFGIFALSAYACGQLCSLLFRSGIIAGFLAVTLTLLVMAWLNLTGMLGVWFMIAAVPIPLWLLWASWLRTRLDRRAPWVAPGREAGRVTGVAGVAIAGATIAYRVLQVPAVAPQIHSLASTPAAEQTADMYRRAADLLASWNGRRAWYTRSKARIISPRLTVRTNLPTLTTGSSDSAGWTIMPRR